MYRNFAQGPGTNFLNILGTAPAGSVISAPSPASMAVCVSNPELLRRLRERRGQFNFLNINLVVRAGALVSL
jgi:hypothetical protein